MKTAKWIIGIVFGLAILYAIVMKVTNDPMFFEKTQPVDSTYVIDTTNDGNIITMQKMSKDSIKVVKRYDEKGQLKSDATIVNGTYNGPSNNYYTSGKVHSTINYVNGQKEGISTWFFESGIPYRETPFKNGKMEGIQRKYYDNGKLMAEIPYVDNELVTGTREFSKMGTIIPFTNNLVSKVSDQTAQNGFMFIDFKLEKKDNNAKYYAMLFEEGKSTKISAAKSDDGFYRIVVASKNGITERQKITLLAETQTKLRNKVLVSKEIEIGK